MDIYDSPYDTAHMISEKVSVFVPRSDVETTPPGGSIYSIWFYAP